MVATTSHIFSGKVDIASNLQVGSSHLFVDTENNRVGIKTVSPDASLHVVGNVYATSFEGDGSLLTGIASNLEQIANNGNVTSNTVQFTNPNTGIVTTGNVEVGNKLSVNSLTPGSVPYIDGENTLVDSYITQGVNTISITSNLEVTGNILVTGDSYKIDSQSLEVKDRIIGVAYENTLSGADTGILMEYPTKNIGLIHHGASGNPYAQEFTIGYTQNTSTDTTILHDTANNITVNVLGHLHTQNNMTVETGGSYYGDGTTLTGVALSVDMTSNALRITNVESVNGSQTGLITGLRTDVTTLTTANTVQASLITGIKTDMTSNASRITTLESANTVQGGLITAIETDVTDNASRITTLESANTVQGGLITVIETNLTDNASRVTSLEATDAVYAGLLSGLRTDLDDTFITKTSDTTVISSNLEVTGNIFMRGERFIIESETTLINDAIIGIANNNTTSTTDVGILMQRPNANVALVHHGGTDTFTIGYTQDTLEATDITNDTTNEINVNVLGQLHVQNNLTVGTGGSYYGDGTTLTGVALSTDMTSNASRITTLESANTVQGSLITAIETDVTDNALRITNLEASNVNIWSNLASNVLRIDELVASNTDIWSNLELLTLNDVVNVNNATSNTVLFTNTDTSLVASGNVTVSGNVTSTTSIVSNVTTMGTTKTFVVTVQQVSGSNKYFIDGVDRPLLELHQHQTYIFDLSSSTLLGGGNPHPFIFSQSNANDGTTGGTEYDTNITKTGSYGSTETRTFVVPTGAPTTLYYYCTSHSGMGASLSISPTAELVVSGRVVASGNVEASAFKGDGTTLTGVALKADLDSNVTRITNLETSNLTYTPLITGLRTDVDAHDTRLDLVEPRVTNLEASNVDIWSNLNLLTLNDVVNVNNATSNTVLFTNANTSLVASGNVTVSGNVTSTTSLISNAATLGTTKEFVVTASGGAFYIDGLIASAKPLELHEHQTYLFDLTAPGAGHPFRLSTTSDGTHGGGSEHTTGTDYSSIANHLKFTVPSGAPSTLYYYCTIHSGMGGSISIASTSELIVSGRVVASGNVEASTFKGDGTELSGIALKTDLVSNVTRIASLRTDMTANAARVDTLYTATTGDIIVATGTNALGKLGVGGSGQVLKVASGGTTLEWANESGGAAGAIVSNSSGITSGFTRGDLIYAYADNTLRKLALGTANQVLKSDGTDVLWGTDGGSAASTPWGTNGNKIFYNTDNVGIGTNAPTFKLDVHGTANVGALTATTLSVGGAAVALDADMTANAARVDALYTATTGDIIYATGTDALGKLNIGVTTGHVLKVSASGTPEWAAESGGGESSKWTTVNTNEIHYSLGNVGIANTNPGHDLSVGSNLFVDDTGSNVLVISGNAAMSALTLGEVSIVASYGLNDILNASNISSNTMQLTNATTGIVVSSNIVVTGNVTAAYLYGDASNVTGIASNLHQIVENGNVTSNTVQFTNATTGLVTTANVEVGGDLTMTGTGALTVPVGTTGQRPDTAANGMIRYNSTTGFMEAYSAVGWAPIAQPPTVTSISPLTTVVTGATEVRTIAYQAEILHPTPTASDEFGKSVSLSSDGTYLIVGSDFDDPGSASASGSAQVYIRDGTSWEWQAELVHPTPTANDYFGRAVAISGNGLYAACGVWADDPTTADTGSVQVYIRDGTSWDWQAELVHPTPAAEDHLGYSVSISSDGRHIITGARYDEGSWVSGSNAGSVQVFVRNSDPGVTPQWTWQAQILHPTTAADDWFGEACAISGDGVYAILGSWNDTKTIYSQGSAQIYIRDGTSWTHQAELIEPVVPASSNKFGFAVAISKDGLYAIVGAYGDDTAVAGDGSAYTFIRAGTGWSYQAKLLHPSPSSNDLFGYSVAISGDGDYAAVGVPRTGYAGSIQVYKRVGTTWTHYYSHLDPDPGDSGSGTDNRLGTSVAISSDGIYIASGSPTDYVGGGASGWATGSVHVAYNEITTVNETDAEIQVFTVTGTGIVSGSTVQLEGANGSLYSVVDATAPNAAGTQVTFKLGLPGTPTNAGTPVLTVAEALAIGTTTSMSGLPIYWDSSTQYTTNTYYYYPSGINSTPVSFTTSVNSPPGGNWPGLPGFDVWVDYDTGRDNGPERYRFIGYKDTPSGTSFVVANQPYKVRINSTSGLIGASTAKIGFPVTWTTAAGANLEFNTAASETQTLAGTDGGGGTNRTFSVAPGSNALPSPLVLTGSTGAITGQIAAVGTTSVTFRLTDTGSGLFTDRAINIVGTNLLYTFTSPFTFTTAGKYGRIGPTITELTTAYSPAWTDDTNYLNVTSTGIQKWTVPVTGTYTITARGSGSVTTNKGGYGARITGTCTLTKSEIIYILVGQTAVNATNSQNHCGGGGTFVVRTPYNTNASIIVIAGGGGAGHSISLLTNGNASLTTTGNVGHIAAGAGGTNGAAGADANAYGGAGFFGNNSQSALSFVNGGTGDVVGSYPAGFGGGGRHGNTHGGGGGGYSGGGGSTDSPYVGGGGGSYKASSFTVTSEDTTVHDGPGSVTITLN